MWKHVYNKVKHDADVKFRKAVFKDVKTRPGDIPANKELWQCMGMFLYAIDEGLYHDYTQMDILDMTLTNNLEGMDKRFAFIKFFNMDAIIYWALDKALYNLWGQSIVFIVYFRHVFSGHNVYYLLLMLFYKNIQYDNIIPLDEQHYLTDLIECYNEGLMTDFHNAVTAIAAELDDFETTEIYGLNIDHYTKQFPNLVDTLDTRRFISPLASAIINKNVRLLRLIKEHCEDIDCDTKFIVHNHDKESLEKTMMELAQETEDEEVLAFVKDWVVEETN